MVGTIAVSARGGFRRRVYGLFGAGLVSGVFLSLVGLRPSIPLLVEGGPLAGSLAGIFGVGPARGIGLHLSLVGVLRRTSAGRGSFPVDNLTC